MAIARGTERSPSSAPAEAPLVSVVIPTHDCGPYVVQAVESALAQTVRDLEIIVVDDGSTDDTAARLRRFGRGIVYVAQDRRGAAAARNAGIARARGAYVAFLDADDLWMPDKLEAQLALAEAHPGVGLVFTDGCFFDDGGVVHASWIAGREGFPAARRLPPGGTWVGRAWRELLLQNFIATPTALVTREGLARAGGFDESYATGEDHHLWVRIAARCDLGYVHRPLARIRLRSGSLINGADFRPIYRNEIRVVEECLPALRRLDLGTRLLCRRRLGDLHFRLAWRLLDVREIAEARGEFGRSIRRWPLRAAPYLYWAATSMPPGVVRRLRAWKGAIARG
jgi:glycosyltransferase involved in cell wall biosynthesis